MSNFGYPLAYATHEESGDSLCPDCIKEYQPTVWDNYYDCGQIITRLYDKEVESPNGGSYWVPVIPDQWDGVWVCTSCDIAESSYIMHCDHCHKVLDMVTVLHLDALALANNDMTHCQCELCLLVSPDIANA